MLRALISIFLPLTLISTNAQADSWIYAGIGIGSTNYESESDAGYSLHMGTGILPLVGIEGGIVEHGRFEDHHDTVELASYYVALKPSIDFANTHLYAKAGAHYWRESSHSNDGLDLTYGIGAEYFILNNLSLGATIMNYTFDGQDAQSYSLAATLHFL